MGKSTRCKFVCQSVRKYKHYDQAKGFLYEATFIPVTATSAENKAFFDATPQGNLTLSTYKEDNFNPGEEYYIDISSACDQTEK